jgi:hypothetical protein
MQPQLRLSDTHVYSSSTIGRVWPWHTSGICTRRAALMAAAECSYFRMYTCAAAPTLCKTNASAQRGGLDHRRLLQPLRAANAVDHEARESRKKARHCSEESDRICRRTTAASASSHFDARCKSSAEHWPRQLPDPCIPPLAATQSYTS